MTTRRPAFDLPTLAAHLRLAGLALVAELAAWLGAGRLAAALRRRVARDLAQLEQFATGIVVLIALRLLPAAPDTIPRGSRPFNAPRGFARAASDDRAMRAMQRRLFPRQRDLSRRLARFNAVLDAVAAYATRLARHIERIPPASRLVAIAPPAERLAAHARVPAAACDSS